jgi:hypothetical protein
MYLFAEEQPLSPNDPGMSELFRWGEAVYSLAHIIVAWTIMYPAFLKCTGTLVLSTDLEYLML